MSFAIRNPSYDDSLLAYKRYAAEVASVVAAIPRHIEFVTFEEIRQALPADIQSAVDDGVMQEILLRGGMKPEQIILLEQQ